MLVFQVHRKRKLEYRQRELIRKLDELKAAGVITGKEYRAKKAKLLAEG